MSKSSWCVTRTALAFLTVALAITLGGRVLADTPPSDADKAAALATVREGNRLLTGGSPEAALEKFKEAHRLVGGEKLYYNFGQAYRAMLGREVDSYQAFQRYLDGAKTAAPESLAAARAEQAQVRTKLALVMVTSSPAGATVTVDGQAQGDTPLPRPTPLPPGAHSLHVTKDGYRPFDETLTVSAGQALDKDVALAPASALAQPAVATAPPPAAAPLATAGVLVVSPLSAPKEDESRPLPFYKKWWLWAAVGAVAIGAIAAVAATRGGGTTTNFMCPPDQSQQCLKL